MSSVNPSALRALKRAACAVYERWDVFYPHPLLQTLAYRIASSSVLSQARRGRLGLALSSIKGGHPYAPSLSGRAYGAKESATFSSLAVNYVPAAPSAVRAAQFGTVNKLDYALVSVDLPGGNTGKWPGLWLRDNCQCNKCIHSDTRQRLVDTFSIPVDIRPSAVRNLENHLEIEWANDGHVSTYGYNWLSEHHLNQDRSAPETAIFSSERQVMANDPKAYPTVLYDEVMSSSDGVRVWTDNIYRWGFSFVKGCPATPEATEKLLERISFIRHTHYGGFWDFTSDLSLKDMAYTAEGLGAHTDTTYFTDPAGLQMFHMLSHTDGSGGESLLVDGFEAAKTLYKEDPEAYRVLTEQCISGHASGNEDVCMQPARPFPVLNHHPVTGELYQVRWNNEDRSPLVDAPPEQINKWYIAARKWNEIIMRKDMERWFQLHPGSPMIFDNWRMLHGRSPFSGKRRICGGYINHDDFMSRYMLLKDGREKVLNRI
ncbi:trimethyllysine dioxygenase [Paracoccidioides brasiliensis Pb18]|uniref:Trimethyllysine dioxygenase n=1 Tax=Paracoccidioides brasiliensis (strain Pb18) TaxID=502780 RepID=C1G160_PARBD|nr:trimethyllysine dioxygenase [Paracoccidioides brasiliensis Pb18]EEH44311.2 trimethyllysine dioxygenase [Paracoccidioides brasiliensis Pb18]